MAKHFDLKRQLRLHDKGLLRRLFAEHGLLGDFPWKGLSARRIDPLVARWEGIEESARRAIQVVLQDAHELADERGQRLLAEELAWRCPEKLPAFAGWRSLADKALWAYLEAREAFDEAALFARAEALRSGQLATRWNSLPPAEITVTQPILTSLEQSIRDYYWEKELRGEVCRVHHYRRPGGAEYFFAYMPDWPDKRLVFDSDGNLTVREEAYTFSNVFIYEPAAGALELVAKGGKPVHGALRKAFCETVLGVEVEDEEPIRPAYRLDHLLDPGFSFRTEPEDRVAAVRLRWIRLLPTVPAGGMESLELRLLETATHAEAMHLIDRLLAGVGLDRTQVRVVEVAIQLQFLSDGHRRGKRMTFHVSCPNTCDLKSKPDDVRVVGQRCIRRWGILL
jgi:hypothetical protein